MDTQNTKENVNPVMKQSSPDGGSTGHFIPLDENIKTTEERLARMKKHQELRDLAKPLQEFLMANHDSHTCICVNYNRVCIAQEIEGVPFSC